VITKDPVFPFEEVTVGGIFDFLERVGGVGLVGKSKVLVFSFEI
jgi:hypothetical protein